MTQNKGSGIQSLFTFLENHLWAIIITSLILAMNYGIMTTQILQIQNEIDTLKVHVADVQSRTGRMQSENAVELIEIKTLMRQIRDDHQTYTEEIRRLNDQLLRIYENQSLNNRNGP